MKRAKKKKKKLKSSKVKKVKKTKKAPKSKKAKKAKKKKVKKTKAKKTKKAKTKKTKKTPPTPRKGAKKKKSAKKVSKAKANKTKKTKKTQDSHPDRISAVELAISKRREPRRLPTEFKFAYLALENDFQDVMCLLIDISEGGCSMVIRSEHELANHLAAGTYWDIKIGHDAPRRAEARWIKKMNEELLNAGFMFTN